MHFGGYSQGGVISYGVAKKFPLPLGTLINFASTMNVSSNSSPEEKGCKANRDIPLFIYGSKKDHIYPWTDMVVELKKQCTIDGRKLVQTWNYPDIPHNEYSIIDKIPSNLQKHVHELAGLPRKGISRLKFFLYHR